MYLFLDSSSFIQVGILNGNFQWIHHEVIPNRKGSQVLHSIIYTSLKENDLKLSDIKKVFLANGPGSYTGIRVAEGLCQVLELSGCEVVSFYHFEVPSFCGLENFEYFSEAFKGEIFYYNFSQDKAETKLIKESAFNEMDLSKDYQYSLEGDILEHHLDCLYDLFKSKPKEIFSRVSELGRRLPPFYYRTEEKEFKPSLI